MTNTSGVTKEQSMLEELLQDFDETSGSVALEKVRKRAEELAPGELADNLPSDILLILSAGLHLQERIEQDRKQLLTIPNVTEELLKDLAILRMALWQTSVQLLLDMPEDSKQSLQEVVNALRVLRQRMFGAIDFVWPTDKDAQTQLAALRKGRGYADLANDGLALHTLFTQRIEKAKEWIKEDKLTDILGQLDTLSPLLLQLRQSSKSNTKTDHTLDLHHRVYSLYEKAYNQVARTGRFLFEETDPVRAIAYAKLYSTYMRLRAQNATPSNPKTIENPSVPQV